ncbi:hypothetical protein BREVUG8_110260 [Brevundimonas sp. G8]|nr:hypothetical protein BREVUG8_110260 [Brevundimonas sp. G8]
MRHVIKRSTILVYIGYFLTPYSHSIVPGGLDVTS